MKLSTHIFCGSLPTAAAVTNLRTRGTDGGNARLGSQVRCPQGRVGGGEKFAVVGPLHFGAGLSRNGCAMDCRPPRQVASPRLDAVNFFQGHRGNCSTRNHSPMQKDLPQITFKQPLVNLWTAVAALGVLEDEVLRMIQDGSLRFAWNIACKNSGKQYVRILAHSISDFQAGKSASPSGLNLRRTLAFHGTSARSDEEYQRAIKLIFPAISHKPDGTACLRLTTIQRRFSVTHTHMARLVREGSLQMCKGDVFRSGPNGSPAITFASVLAFMKARRML